MTNCYFTIEVKKLFLNISYFSNLNTDLISYSICLINSLLQHKIFKDNVYLIDLG